MSYEILQGDCIERMAEMEEASVDAVVCDPPYGLSKEPDIAEVLSHWLAGDDYEHRGGGFMGQSWDSFVPGPAYWRATFRVLKPGGHLLAFAGSRTADLMGISIRFAGFEIRDSIMWLYGTGFPKSLDVSKAIDKAAGAEREDLGESTTHHGGGTNNVYAQDEWTKENFAKKARITAPATPEAAQWDGWGTALKPAHEPVVVARKPLVGTVAANFLEHGTGGLNIDACRIEGANPSVDRRESARRSGNAPGRPGEYGDTLVNRISPERYTEDHPGEQLGRFPANVVLSHTEDCNGECAPGCPAAELDLQSGRLQSGSRAAGVRTGMGYGGANGDGGPATVGDSGGASRFFYQTKTSRAERNAGLEGFEEKPASDRFRGERKSTLSDPRMDREQERRPAANNHPTVKPINLMRWLVRLVTPPGGTILDPFLGSGTTGCAAALEGFDFVGIEREPEYIAIAEARIAFWAQQEGRETKDVLKASKKRKAPDPTQPELLEAA